MSSFVARTRPEIPALTSLRFFAALWVVLFHIREFGLWSGGPRPYIAVIRVGYLGVSFFFVLSGFILSYVYTGRNTPKLRFWQARFARVYPVYLFSLLITLPLVIKFMLPYMRQMHVSPALVFTMYPLLLEAWSPEVALFWNGVAWSLSVEAFFYFVFPFLLPFFTRLSAKGLLLVSAAAWSVDLLITSTYVLLRPDGLAHTSSQDALLYWLTVVKFNPLIRLPDFLLGMAAGTCVLRWPSQLRRGPVVAGAAFLLVVIVFGAQLPYPLLHSGLAAPAFALIIIGIAAQPAWNVWLGHPWLLLLGEASYSLYLLHAIPLVILTSAMHLGEGPHVLVVVASYLVAMLLVSALVYRGIEYPLRRILRPRNLPQSVPTPALQA